ncbi:MAG: DNA/RNA nuclease SfsA [Gammaproteobacteria bacterium]
MKFSPPLQSATLIRRYKRFLTDIETDDGQQFTIHCPNTGSMKNCSEPGSQVWYSTSDSKTRKYPHTLEIIRVSDKELAGINTGRANHLVREAIEIGLIKSLSGYRELRSEVKYGKENSRVDFLLQDHPRRNGKACYIEVKNVTLGMGKGLGLFPDAVSTRGTKHLRELIHIASEGDRAVLFFCVQHTGIEKVQPAWDIDPEYSQTLVEAKKAGVEIMAWQAVMSSSQISLAREIPVSLTRRSQ